MRRGAGQMGHIKIRKGNNQNRKMAGRIFTLFKNRPE